MTPPTAEAAEEPPDDGNKKSTADQGVRIEGEPSSPIFDLFEIVVVGACIGAMYSAGRDGQLRAAFFIATTLLFIYYERKYRKQLDALIKGESGQFD